MQRTSSSSGPQTSGGCRARAMAAPGSARARSRISHISAVYLPRHTSPVAQFQLTRVSDSIPSETPAFPRLGPPPPALTLILVVQAGLHGTYHLPRETCVCTWQEVDPEVDLSL
jgi:hypothetical protein